MTNKNQDSIEVRSLFHLPRLILQLEIEDSRDVREILEIPGFCLIGQT